MATHLTARPHCERPARSISSDAFTERRLVRHAGASAAKSAQRGEHVAVPDPGIPPMTHVWESTSSRELMIRARESNNAMTNHVDRLSSNGLPGAAQILT